MWANMNERMTAIFVKTSTRSIEIVSNTTKEALSNLGEAVQVRENAADYTKAYSDFAQKQVELLKRTAQEVGDLTKQAGTETKELATEAGEELSSKVAANAKEATDKVAAIAKDAAEITGSAAKTTA